MKIRRLYVNVFMATLGFIGMYCFWVDVFKAPFFNFWSLITGIMVWLCTFFYLSPKKRTNGEGK